MKKFTILVALTYCVIGNAQEEDLLSQLDKEEVSTEVTSVFKSMKIINLESTKLAAKGDFYFIASHRFGSIKGGGYDLFGLDQANTNFRFTYGLTKGLTISASRGSFNKTYDATIKYNLKTQTLDFPVTIVGYNGVAFNTMRTVGYTLSNTQRTSYVNQLLISRKFSNNFSFEVAPTFFHENFVINDAQQNSQFAFGLGGRYKITSRLSLNVDYAYHFNRALINRFQNPLSIGVDIETGGHVFQLHFTNARTMNETSFLGSAEGNWSKADVFFGFNIVRVF